MRANFRPILLAASGTVFCWRCFLCGGVLCVCVVAVLHVCMWLLGVCVVGSVFVWVFHVCVVCFVCVWELRVLHV